jgi:predicted RNA-binding Zn ribbon-like protein
MHKFHRGTVALDFIGTLGWRTSRREERIPDPGAFGEWLVQAGLTDAPPTRADHEAALELREALAAIAEALVAGRRPPDGAVAVLNRALEWNRLSSEHFDPDALALVAETREPVRFALARIATDAANTFARHRAQLTRCEDPACSGFLLSRSRGDRRRWCTASGCGNRARVAAYRKRQGAGAASGD